MNSDGYWRWMLKRLMAILRGHKMKWNRRQKRTTFYVKSFVYLFHFLRRPFYAPEHLFTWGFKCEQRREYTAYDSGNYIVSCILDIGFTYQ